MHNRLRRLLTNLWDQEKNAQPKNAQPKAKNAQAKRSVSVPPMPARRPPAGPPPSRAGPIFGGRSGPAGAASSSKEPCLAGDARAGEICQFTRGGKTWELGKLVSAKWVEGGRQVEPLAGPSIQVLRHNTRAWNVFDRQTATVAGNLITHCFMTMPAKDDPPETILAYNQNARRLTRSSGTNSVAEALWAFSKDAASETPKIMA